MARIEADPDARRPAEVTDDRRQVFESIAEGPPLARRVLEDDHRAASRPRGERLANRICNEAKCVLLGARRARARMKDHTEQPQCVGAIELVDERGDGLGAQRGERGGEIDQIARV